MKEYIKNNRHALLLLYLPLYLIAFFTIDKLPLTHYVIRCPLDDYIPFNQNFIIPYSIWFFWFPGWILYFLKHSKEDFVRLCVTMFTGMTVCLLIYLIWPNAIDLREEIRGNDICSKAVRLIREADTPYGVCPSIHVLSLMSIALTVKDSELPDLSITAKSYIYVITIVIIYSTMAVKQHSIVDVAAGAALAVVIDFLYVFFREKHGPLF